MKRLLIQGGTIHTMDEKHPIAKNVYVENEVIKALDLSQEQRVELEECQGIEVINLDGRCMLPGFHDSHLHLLQYGINQMDGVDLSEATSVEEVKALMKRYIKDSGKSPGAWVLGYGWNHENFPDKRMPTAKDLDEISTEHYLMVKRICIHIATVNSKLLELCNITKNTFIGSEQIGRLDNGEADGLIYEDAISSIIMSKKPVYSIGEIEEILMKSGQALRSCGFTAVQTDDMKTFSAFESKINILKAYDNLRNQGKLPIRIMEQLQVSSLNELKALLTAVKHIKNDHWFAVQTIKLILDGSLGGWTAAMSKPYKDNPQTMGILNFTDEEVIEIADYCYENNINIAFHAIGDRTIDQILNTIERMKKKHQKDIRPRIVHCQLSRKEQLEKMAELSVIADIQPMFVSSDYKVVEERLEESCLESIYAWKTLLGLGVSLSGSSDCPVEKFEPFLGIKAAVTRTDLNGEPKGGWKPKEKLTIEEAIRLYTVGSAYSVGKERLMGSIRTEGFADLVILESDPYLTEEENLHQVQISKVICGGQ